MYTPQVACRKEYTFQRHFNEKPSIVSGCPGQVSWTCCVLTRLTRALLLQASMAEAEQETLEEAMTTNRERHYMNVAAECKVSNQTLQNFLEDIEVKSKTGDVSAASKGCNAFELLPSASIHRLGLGFSDLTW